MLPEKRAMSHMADSRSFCLHGLLAMLLGISVSLYLGYDAKVDAELLARERFVAAADDIRMHLLNTLASHEQVLLGAAALFDASEEVGRSEWQRYVRRLELDEHFDCVQGVGYAAWLTPAQLARHIDSVRREGFPEYIVWPQGKRDQYSSIVYLEPFDARNQRAFGYDMFAEPTRRAAMERARDSGRAALSAKVKLVQETTQDIQAGTLMYIPLYRHGMPLDTVAQRRAALQGWVYSPFRMGNMIDTILKGAHIDLLKLGIRLRVYDGAMPDANALLYASDNEPESPAAPDAILQRISFNDHTWTLQLEHDKVSQFSPDYSKAKMFFFGGTFTSILLFFLINALSQARTSLQRAENAVSALRKSEDNLRVLAKNESVLIWTAGPDKACTHFNQVWLDFTGRTLEQELGDGWLQGVHPEDREECLHGYLAAFDARHDFTLEYRLRHHSGEYRWIVDHGVPRFNEQGEFLGYIGSGVDITERKKAETQLKLSKFAMDNAFDEIFWLDRQGHIRYVNNKACATLGYTREELLKFHISDLDPDFPPAHWQRNWEAIKVMGNRLFETRHRRKDGTLLPIEVSANYVKFDDQEYHVAFCRDISKRKETEQQIYSLAYYDSLTGLPNRRMLGDRLDKALASSRRNGTWGALLFLDLDNFKPLNDRFGHEAGDILLGDVAQRLNACVREVDTVARYGGDEFIILLGELAEDAETMQEQARTVAEKVLKALAEPYHLHEIKDGPAMGIVHHCSSSIGITLFKGRHDKPDDILNRGDAAMYRAKEAGRNRYHFSEGPLIDNNGGRALH